MKAIQKELGREDHTHELVNIKEKSKKLGLSKEAAQKLDKELQRLEQMPPLSAEAVVSRHYVDWLTSLPWKKESKDRDQWPWKGCLPGIISILFAKVKIGINNLI